MEVQSRLPRSVGWCWAASVGPIRFNALALGLVQAGWLSVLPEAWISATPTTDTSSTITDSEQTNRYIALWESFFMGTANFISSVDYQAALTPPQA